MNYQFTDIPKYIPAETYQHAINRMRDYLLETGKVKSVYQVGGVTSPGISDLDLFIVFNDDVSYYSNPVSSLSYPDNYLFTHRLFGTCERMAVQLEQYTFFGKYHFLGGTDIQLINYTADTTGTEQLKHQIALEYLVKAWYSNAIGMIFGTIKLRNLLLHAKAILLDLEFLGIKNGNLVDCIGEIMEVRSGWFVHPASPAKLTGLVNRYDSGLKEAIHETIGKFGFFLPESANRKMSKRVTLQESQDLELIHNGWILPAALTHRFSSVQKIQNRINRFSVGIPITRLKIPSILEERHSKLREAFGYNHKYLPGFLCTGHAMNVFAKE